MLVGRGGVEPPTFHFSGGRSYRLSYLPERPKLYNNDFASRHPRMAGVCGLGRPAHVRARSLCGRRAQVSLGPL